MVIKRICTKCGLWLAEMGPCPICGGPSKTRTKSKAKAKK